MKTISGNLTKFFRNFSTLICIRNEWTALICILTNCRRVSGGAAQLWRLLVRRWKRRGLQLFDDGRGRHVGAVADVRLGRRRRLVAVVSVGLHLVAGRVVQTRTGRNCTLLPQVLPRKGQSSFEYRQDNYANLCKFFHNFLIVNCN